MDFLQVLPDLVRGNASIAADNRKDAIGPIRSLTITVKSRLIAVSFFLASRTQFLQKFLY